MPVELNGMGIKRGYILREVLLVAHGGNHNDTICTVEQALYVNVTKAIRRCAGICPPRNPLQIALVARPAPPAFLTTLI